MRSAWPRRSAWRIIARIGAMPVPPAMKRNWRSRGCAGNMNASERSVDADRMPALEAVELVPPAARRLQP